MPVNAMAADPIAFALATLSDDDLARLRAAVDASPAVVPGLLAYLDHAADWEHTGDGAWTSICSRPQTR